MKIFMVTFAYPEYITYLYDKNPDLAGKPFAEQKEFFRLDSYGKEEFWGGALAKYGYEFREANMNAEPMQKAWASERGFTADPIHIVIRQIKEFAPDILWYNYHDEPSLRKILAEIPPVRLIISSVGSALQKTGLWKHIDLVLSCAPETIEKLSAQGVYARQLHHAFDGRINERLKDMGKPYDISFSGKIIRNVEFHLIREQILEYLANEMELVIFSPSAHIGLTEFFKYTAKMFLYGTSRVLMKTKPTRKLMDKIKVYNKVTKWDGKPLPPINKKLKPFLKPPVFGLDMYQTVKNSKIALNIHADSSPRYASNVRMFEIPGPGACLLTDWKQNIGELFEPDKEVVTYKSPEECLEKAKWLISHPAEMEAIARAGQARTLKNHSYTARAERLDEIIRTALKAKSS